MNWDVSFKQSALKSLRKQWDGCTDCPLLAECRNNIVFGNGYADADVMFIGDAPGNVEDRTGYPFTGKSGKMLTAFLNSLSAPISLDAAYSTNLVMCQPPEDREPLKTERAACRQRLEWEIYIVDPMIIVPVGRQAMESLMGRGSIDSTRGKVGKVVIPGRKVPVTYDAIPIWHPAYLLRMERPDKPGKLTEQTLSDLQLIFDSVELVKTSYEQFRRKYDEPR